MKDYLMGLVVFSIVGFFAASIYGIFAFAVVYSLIVTVYKLYNIEAKLDEMSKINK